MSPPLDDANSQSDAVEIQDNRREAQMRVLFRLTKRVGAGRIDEDAIDEDGNPFELKSATKASVTTARDVGPHTLEKWRGRFWICARGTNTYANGFTIDQAYFLSPSMMKRWIDELETRFQKDLALLDAVTEALAVRSFSEADIARVTYLVRRGLTLNNPKISWRYVEAHGIPFDLSGDPAEQLRHLVKQYPRVP